MSSAITTTATTLPGQFLEIARELQEAELSIAEGLRPNNIQITTDVENLTVTITSTLPISFGGTGGAMSFTANDYLA
jgi:hypothetical protein